MNRTNNTNKQNLSKNNNKKIINLKLLKNTKKFVHKKKSQFISNQPINDYNFTSFMYI